MMMMGIMNGIQEIGQSVFEIVRMFVQGTLVTLEGSFDFAA